jgi:deoxyribonuclease V
MAQLLDFIAGVDAAYLTNGTDSAAVAAAVTLRSSDLRLVDVAYAASAEVGGYEPGKFAAREGEVALRALRALRRTPDAVICHGHGRAHPERHGLACWVGDRVKVPTLGCCQNLLCGAHADVGPEPGDRAEVSHRGEVVGAALRTGRDMNPVYVSVGWGIDLDRAVSVVMSCTGRFRLPLPLRLSDVVSRGLMKNLDY